MDRPETTFTLDEVTRLVRADRDGIDRAPDPHPADCDPPPGERGVLDAIARAYL